MISSASHSVNAKTLSAHRKRLVCVYCVAATRRSYTEIGKSMPQTPLQIYISYALGGAIPARFSDANACIRGRSAHSDQVGFTDQKWQRFFHVCSAAIPNLGQVWSKSKLKWNKVPHTWLLECRFVFICDGGWIKEKPRRGYKFQCQIGF